MAELSKVVKFAFPIYQQYNCKENSKAKYMWIAATWKTKGESDNFLK